MDDALLGLHGAPTALETEWPCHHTDCQSAGSLRYLGHDGGSTGSGSATFARRDEDHVGALQRLLDFGPMFLGSLPSDLRVTPCTKTPGEVPADIQLHVGVAHK